MYTNAVPDVISFLDGNLAEYAIGLEAKIGTERFEALRQRRGKGAALYKVDLREKIKEYKQKVKELKKEFKKLNTGGSIRHLISLGYKSLFFLGSPSFF